MFHVNIYKTKYFLFDFSDIYKFTKTKIRFCEFWEKINHVNETHKQVYNLIELEEVSSNKLKRKF